MLGGPTKWANELWGGLWLGIGAMWGYQMDLLSQLGIQVERVRLAWQLT